MAKEMKLKRQVKLTKKLNDVLDSAIEKTVRLKKALDKLPKLPDVNNYNFKLPSVEQVNKLKEALDKLPSANDLNLKLPSVNEVKDLGKAQDELPGK